MTISLAAAAMLVAAALHGYMFVHESVLFTRRPATQRMLEVKPADVTAVRLWAFHQGVYNLLLAGTGAAGAVALLADFRDLGVALISEAGASMVVAAVALVWADRRRQRLAGLLAQALPPTTALLLVAISTTQP